MPVHMIRCKTIRANECVYDQKTDVWVYGDCVGFAQFAEELHHAINARSVIHVTSIPDDTRGMLCVILPAATESHEAALLKIRERWVFRNGQPFMQVIIYGNAEGYRGLAAICNQARDTQLGPAEHWHLDPDNEIPLGAIEDENGRRIVRLVPGSIALNIRGCAAGWSQLEIEEPYFQEVSSGGAYRLPESVRALNPSETCEFDVSPDGWEDYLRLG